MGSTLTVDNIVGATTAANVKFPEGTPVGWKTASAVVSTQFNTNSFVTPSGITLSYAPKYSTSILYFNIHLHAFFGQYQNNWATVGCKLINTTDSVILFQDVGYGTGKYSTDANDREMSYIGFNGAYSPNSASSKTYAVQVAKLAGGGSGAGMDVNNPSYGGGGRITVMEIAQ